MSGFWRNWMTRWCWGVALFGLVLAGAGLEATSGPTRLLFGALDGPEPLNLNAQMRFSLALLGAVTLGWALTLRAALGAAHALGARARPTWLGITASLLVWYLLDSGLSVATGFGLNAVSNTVIVAAFLIPILRGGVLRSGPA